MECCILMKVMNATRKLLDIRKLNDIALMEKHCMKSLLLQMADALVGCPYPNIPCYLYKIDMVLRCPITEEQNTRGRKIHAPEETTRCFGILSEHELPMVCYYNKS